MTTQFILQSAVNFPVAMWIVAPPSTYQGCISNMFKLYLYTEDNTPHTVQLYSQGSDSMPWQDPQNKWSHLNPQWRFTDLNGDNVNELTLTNAVSAIFNGTTGYMSSAVFFYTDDLPTYVGGITLWATAEYDKYPAQIDTTLNAQSVPGYANSKIVTAVSYLVEPLTPSYLQVTRDGINPMSNFYWIDTPIPYVVSVIGTTMAGPYTAVMMNVPTTNLIGAAYGSIVRHINKIPDTDLIWTPDNGSAYLSAVDNENFPIAGYIRGDVVSISAASSVAIHAYGNVSYGDLTYPYLWVSNPENNTLNRIFAPHINETLLSPSAMFITDLTETVFDTSYLQVTAPTTNMAVTGFGGIYGIAVDNNKNVWCTDAESDKVYEFSPYGMLLSSFNFGENNTYNFGATGGCTPAGIAVDNLSGVWITFFDSASVVCLDQYTGTIKHAINFDFNNAPYTDTIIKPVLAEPDNSNNLWITFNNTLCSVLMKYDPIAQNVITSITLPTCSNPMDIHITKDNDVWVSLAHYAGPPYGISTVRKYMGSSPFTLLYSVTATNPSYLAMDLYESLWFTQSGNTLTRVSSAGMITNWPVGASVPSAYFSSSDNILYENALEGLCCDKYNRIYIINSIDNYLYVVLNDQVYYGCSITPAQHLEWYNDNGSIYTSTDLSNKSAQAFGDWSGNRWQRKYGGSPITNVALSGMSNLFNIYDFGGYDIRRYNESWDAVNQVRQYARTPQIADNPTYWDGYMKAVWGDASSPQGTGFGREAYEKIANFIPNSVDINTCNINQLYSLAKCVDITMDNYGFQLPPELRRIMDICSVNQQQLWGSRCKCYRNITNSYTTYTSGQQIFVTDYTCDYCGHMHPGNRGSIFDASSYVVTAFKPFIVEDKVSNNYQLIIPPLSGTASTYPLSSYYQVVLPAGYNYSTVISSSGFHAAIAYFHFYGYVESSCEQQIAGIINWDDPHTTLDETISSVSDWYGNGQTLERIINYTLYKGLGLIEG